MRANAAAGCGCRLDDHQYRDLMNLLSFLGKTPATVQPSFSIQVLQRELPLGEDEGPARVEMYSTRWRDRLRGLPRDDRALRTQYELESALGPQECLRIRGVVATAEEEAKAAAVSACFAWTVPRGVLTLRFVWRGAPGSREPRLPWEARRSRAGRRWRLRGEFSGHCFCESRRR